MNKNLLRNSMITIFIINLKELTRLKNYLKMLEKKLIDLINLINLFKILSQIKKKSLMDIIKTEDPGP